MPFLLGFIITYGASRLLSGNHTIPTPRFASWDTIHERGAALSWFNVYAEVTQIKRAKGGDSQ